MKVLVTGANGFLGYYLLRALVDNGFETLATGRGPFRHTSPASDLFRYQKMDFTDPYQVHDVFQEYQPDIVIHAGAMARPDACEQEQWQAYLVNVEGTLNIMLNAAELNGFLIYISTDFVFDGIHGMYSEEDIPAPINYYGKTKLEAEEIIREYAGDWAIVRTVLVYGKPVKDGNLLTVVRDKLMKGETYSVVDDQERTPTYVEDLVDGIIRIINRKAVGVFHISGKDKMTPYQMAIRVAETLKLEVDLIKRVTAESFSQPARRPAKTGFKIDKAREILGYEPISFEEGLKKTFAGLL